MLSAVVETVPNVVHSSLRDSEDDGEIDFEKISSNQIEIPKDVGFSWSKLAAFIGPAFFVSIGYLDPGNCLHFSFFFFYSNVH